MHPKKSVTGIVSTGNVLQVYDSKNKKISSYTLVIYGDVNGDGKINKTDLNRLNRHLNGTQKLTGCYLKAADTNRKKDGVNVLDLVYLNKHLQGEDHHSAVKKKGRTYETKKQSKKENGYWEWYWHWYF